MEKIYVIGGAGFVGTHFCQLLADRQKKFIIVDLKESKRFPEASRISDIRDKNALINSIYDITPNDTIVHLAAIHRDDVRDINLYYSTNVSGTENVCAAASHYGVKKIIFTSSVAVYGFAPVGTDESGEINPFNEYGRTKYMAEKVLNSWSEGSDSRSTVIVRPTVIFGPGNRGNVYNLLNQIASGKFLMIGPGNNKKSMAYVDNVAAFLLHSSEVKGGNILVNYVDTPDLDMNNLVSMVRGAITKKSNVGIRLPYYLGLFLGYIADFISKISGKNLPVSSIRVKKFCSDSSFSSAKESIDNFRAPMDLKKAIIHTVNAEFIYPDENREIFYTE